MLHRAACLVILLACSSFTLPVTGLMIFACASEANAGETQQPASSMLHGKVTDILDAAGYTYAEVDTGREKVWAAATTTPLQLGDMVSFATGMPMKDFHSNALNRDFPVIYFVNRFITARSGQAGRTTAMASPHGKHESAPAAKAVEGVNKVEGGSTIAEIYDGKRNLNGKAVRVRGKVTRYTAGVMGRNWLHIRDSSTLDDLAVTTGDTAAVDAVVIVEGKLALDKDFGNGLVYPLIVEDATVTRE